MKENIDIIVVYNLLDSNGTKLQLRLGRYKCSEDYFPGQGFRWSFVGSKIPMPVRAYTWFNGFPENIMLDWLKGNGWALRSRVEMSTGKATIYELPSAEFAPEPEHTAREMYNNTVSIALAKCMKDIKKAKEDGSTSCYIHNTLGKPPVEVIKALLNAGYDITYISFGKGYGDWFVKAYWDRPKSKGKIFIGDTMGAGAEVTIDDYKNA